MGDYDVEIPCDTAAGEYKVRVGRFEDTTLFGCSGAFDIVSSGDSGSSDSGDSSDSDSKGGDSSSSDSSDSDDMSMSYTF